MNKYFFVFALLVLGLSNCGEPDTIGRVSFIGRADGWRADAVESNLESLAASAIAQLSDAQIAATGRTRESIQAQYDLRVTRETMVEDCDRDDLIFFLDNGQMRIIFGNVGCPDPQDPGILAGFNDNFYRADLDATRFELLRPDQSLIANFEVLELTENVFRLETTRTVTDSLVGTINYDWALRLVAN
ncbi:hypothetical protein QWY85_05650 [Neolewinella lacunae]|uniref:Uncharacterized protein n=1 Tax=Neolewinella lacunae TaxID=1517758 RepID=A0A923T834_9BACT|nr:hypothetical protein [Neolewinella lacunae]MBC6995185.1 hypothetical protein [Neolewinella lacunae]MDN3634135.1 hypothetical protein [Neolewinella lacunae]